ncbi:MAG: 6,7-dimethyl-8-ribityllumazine synthase [Ferruginibacter sp.]
MALPSTGITDISGIQLSKDACIIIVRTEWNADIIDLLEKGCREVMEQNNICHKVINVPGAFEIPFAIKNYWDNHKYKDDKPTAFIALGCVMRGDTPHFDYVCKGVTDGITQLNLLLPVPTVFGILTVDNKMQADERTGGRHGHKGKEAAATAIKMIALSQSFKLQTGNGRQQ